MPRNQRLSLILRRTVHVRFPLVLRNYFCFPTVGMQKIPKAENSKKPVTFANIWASLKPFKSLEYRKCRVFHLAVRPGSSCLSLGCEACAVLTAVSRPAPAFFRKWKCVKARLLAEGVATWISSCGGTHASFSWQNWLQTESAQLFEHSC